MAKNVCLINPLLGSPAHNYIYQLYENQLAWIAEAWANLCKRGADVFGEKLAVTPLLIGGGEFGTYVIDEKGSVHSVDA